MFEYTGIVEGTGLIRCLSCMNTWIDCIFEVDISVINDARIVIEKALTSWFSDPEAESTPYGDWIEDALTEVGIEYTAYYSGQ